MKNFLVRLAPLLRYCYTMFIVVNAWVFFRIDDMSDAFDYMQAMYFLNDHSESFNLKIHNSFNSLFITSLVFWPALLSSRYSSVLKRAQWL